MKIIIIMTCILSLTTSSFAGSYRIKLSSSEKFEVEAPSAWTLKREKYEKNEKAWFILKPKDQSFLLHMFFKKVPYRTSPENLKKATIRMGEKHLPKCIEDSVETKPMDLDKGHGIYVVLTDREIDESDPGDFRYITRGAIGLSDNVELSFLMLTHEADGEIQKSLIKYMAEYIK